MAENLNEELRTSAIDIINVSFRWSFNNPKFFLGEDESNTPPFELLSEKFGGGRWQLKLSSNEANSGYAGIFLNSVITDNDREKQRSLATWRIYLVHSDGSGAYHPGSTSWSNNFPSEGPPKDCGSHEWVRRSFLRENYETGFIICVELSEAPPNLGFETLREHCQFVSQKLMSQNLADFNQPSTSDVVFVFQDSKGREKRLYARKAVLCEESEYFRDMFSAGFIESSQELFNFDPSEFAVPNSEVEDRKPGQPFKNEYRPDEEFEQPEEDADSDYEDFTETPDTQTISKNYAVIRVNEAKYSTFKAMILWLLTGQITFKPLTSSRLPPKPATFVSIYSHNVPTPPCSPKSCYKLADRYRMEDLKQICFKAIVNSLTVEGITREVFSSFSGKYSEVCNAQVTFLLNHWDEVKKTNGWRSLMSDHTLSKDTDTHKKAWMDISDELFRRR